jgi:hypothetical protein
LKSELSLESGKSLALAASGQKSHHPTQTKRLKRRVGRGKEQGSEVQVINFYYFSWDSPFEPDNGPT